MLVYSPTSSICLCYFCLHDNFLKKRVHHFMFLSLSLSQHHSSHCAFLCAGIFVFDVSCWEYRLNNTSAIFPFVVGLAFHFVLIISDKFHIEKTQQPHVIMQILNVDP